jgi:hypothetical protein
MPGKNRWPLIPDHITSRPAIILDEELRRLDGIGIIPNEFLKGLLTVIANYLENPVTVLEFPRDKNLAPVRTDTGSIHFNLHPPCKKLREWKNTYCMKFDGIHSELFRGLYEKDMDVNLRKRIDSLKYTDTIQDMFGVKSNVRIKKLDNRFYIEYDCLILGYRELVFPIIVEKKVVGVLFMGQLFLEEELENINRRRNHFFNWQSDSDSDAFFKEVERLDQEWKKNKIFILSGDAYRNLVGKAIKQIFNLEGTLNTELETQRKNYCTQKVDSYIRCLRTEMNKSLPKGSQKLKRFWRKIEIVLEKVIDDFPAKHIAFFAQDSYVKDPPVVLDMVASEGLARKGYKNYKYDLRMVPAQLTKEILTSMESPLLLKGFQDRVQLDESQDLIRLFPSPLSTHGIFVIWIRYNNETWPRLLEEKKVRSKSDKIFNQAFISFYTFISSIYASVLTDLANSLLEKTFRVWGHETGQITTGIDAIRKQYLNAKWKHLSIEKVENINRDVEGLLRQLNFLSESVKTLFSEVSKIDKKPFYDFEDLFYKWKSTFGLETNRKQLKVNIEIGYKYKSEAVKPPIYGDVLVLEQILYNLINNAIKYCYRGTNIRIDFRRTGVDWQSPYILSVTDFGGIEIEDREKIFELFERGENVKGIEGFGIGLYVAKKMAIAHGGKISVICNKISNYNIPLMESFLTRSASKKGEGQDKNLIDNVQRDYENLKQSGDFNRIIATNQNKPCYIPTRKTVEMFISKATYNVTFEVEIPST